MEEQKYLHKELSQKQEKFHYFIISVSVSAIGFSVFKTYGESLNWYQLALGLANLSWGLSIFCGLKHLSYAITSIRCNIDYLYIQEGVEPYSGKSLNEDCIKAGSECSTENMNNNSNKAALFSIRQERLFYAGIILFIIWHVLEMYGRTSF